ncbi:MAG: DUF4236 domain-containing protein [Gammaproteobacteria bacterium]|nr:DUF4236 domain-containing protein [Gammaproteobacteria bacterium]MDE2348095.1 DUF4236 domain-containing protein [Gammaproteobacteria bacterium]
MGFRFRRTIRVAPGIRVNLSRSGVSTSVGVRGAHVTLGHGRVRESLGVPGTGLSYTTTQSARPPWRIGRVLFWLFAIVFMLPFVIGALAALWGSL